MMFRALIALALCGVSVVVHAAFDLDQLLDALARQPAGRAQFVETRHLALLDKPVKSSGELSYQPPDRLEKRTLQPRAESITLDKDVLTLEQGQRRLTFSVASRPEARAFVESVRSTLAGDRPALEKHYRLALQGSLGAWQLVLTPTDPAVAELLQRIVVQGQNQHVRRIEYQQVDGDRTELSITPLSE